MSLSRQQWTLLGIFALFLGPVLLVILMRSSWWQYQPSGLKNHGQLVQPPVQLELNSPQVMLRKWAILHILDQNCDRACIERVTTLRQIHRASGRHGEHLAIVLLSEVPISSQLQTRLELIYPEFIFITDSEGTSLPTLTSINQELHLSSADSNSILSYILDPAHNVILAYRSDANPSDIHKDLKRLLKWSDQENG